VYWFRRPPYLRWAAAAILIVSAAWMDLRPEPVVSQPFAAVDLITGTQLDQTMIEWRSIPAGLLPPLPNPEGIVLHEVAAGEPLVPSLVSAERIPVPDGWWTMEVQLPPGSFPGQQMQLIVLPDHTSDPARSLPGLVIVPAPVEQDPLAVEPAPGLVAVPNEYAPTAAAAIAGGKVTVILGAESG
jgi:hypothetical protein